MIWMELKGYCFSLLLLFNINISYQDDEDRGKRYDISTFNPKVVGVILKANGKRYFINSELCPGGIFLTKPVNENCLCYNGIFQLVRNCCSSGSTTSITTDNLEWRMDYKCGTSPGANTDAVQKPIRAILPLSKPDARFSSIVVPRTLTGNNTAKWRKFDTEDIIVRNDAQLGLSGKTQFEVVNLKPLGREIRVNIGRAAETSVCFTGWLTDQGHQNLRVRLIKAGPTIGGGCCLNVTQENTPGEITAECTDAQILTEIVDVQSADMDIGQCDQETAEKSPHTIKKRKTPEYETIHFKRSPYSQTLFFTREKPEVSFSESRDQDDFIGDKGRRSILVRRQAPWPVHNDFKNETSKEDEDVGNGTASTSPSPVTGSPRPRPTNPPPPLEPPPPEFMISPRLKGISGASSKEQSEAVNMFIAILRNDLMMEIREPQTMRFQLLKKSFDIFLKVVPNHIIPHVMLKTAFDVFYFLYEELEPMLHTPPKIFNRTMEYLDSCLTREQMLNFTTYRCPPEIDSLVLDSFHLNKLETFYAGDPEQLERVKKAAKYAQIKKDRRFIVERHDIYVEINWKVVDFVHSFCFEHFSTEFNSHHFYESELEKLFLFPEVQKRWFSQSKDLRYVQGVLPVSDLKTRMKELDKVAAVGHYLSRYNGTFWLFRPSVSPGHSQDSFKEGISATHEEKRLIFTRNMMDEASYLAAERDSMGSTLGGRSIHTSDREIIYPFQFPDKLPAGELIWDGLAVCLHAGYSNRRSYFLDSQLWGIVPALQDLGKIYP